MIREIIDTVRGRDRWTSTRSISIKGIVGDYLPTTLRAYLALDPALPTTPRPSGRTPRAVAARAARRAAGRGRRTCSQATQAHDVDALMTQGNFLRTKFSGSDLDL